MSARSIGNAYGVVITCNYDDCASRFQTANVRKSANRAAAAKEGWRRGGGEAPQAVGRLPDARPRGGRARAA